MKREVLKRIPLRVNPFRGWGEKIHRVLFWGFLFATALTWVRLWVAAASFADARWPEGLFIVLTAATTVASLARRLPGQNVMMASIIIGFIAGGLQTLGALTGIPFGPYVYTNNIGQLLF